MLLELIKLLAVVVAITVIMFLFFVLLWFTIGHQLPIAIGILAGLFVYGLYLIITGDWLV